MNELTVTDTAELTVNDIRRQVNLIQQVLQDVMLGPSDANPDGVHYGVITGCKKPSLYKAGAEKLCQLFQFRLIIDPQKDIVKNDLPDGHREYSCTCHLLNRKGEEVATGIGLASTMESKFRYRGGEKKSTGKPIPTNYWNLNKEGKKKEAQELIGGKGFAPGKIDGQWVVCEIGEKMENPDIADVHNTVLKMAKKRAFVDGTITATACSDIFTQDIEDLPAVETTATFSAPKESTPPQRKQHPLAATTTATETESTLTTPTPLATKPTSPKTEAAPLDSNPNEYPIQSFDNIGFQPIIDKKTNKTVSYQLVNGNDGMVLYIENKDIAQLIKTAREKALPIVLKWAGLETHKVVIGIEQIAKI